MDNIYILGKNSFVGAKLYQHMHSKTNAHLIGKETIDFLKPETFSNINFDKATIIDCINVNNGNEKEIMDCNYNGFVNFCNYLVKSGTAVNYVYISTVSTIAEEVVRANAYVRSKKMAEDHLIQSGLNFQIIRLSYPIGAGENKDRLVSKMISLLKENKEIKINDIEINFNDIDDVCEDISNNLLKDKITFISNNKYTSLYENIIFLKEALHSKSKIIKTTVANGFMPVSDTPFVATKNIKETLLGML